MLVLHGASDSQVMRGNTLRSRAYFSGDNLDEIAAHDHNVNIPR